jgi:hypothetical protein
LLPGVPADILTSNASAPGLVDVILGAAKARTGERGETGDPEAFHDKSGRSSDIHRPKAAAVGANAVLRVLKCTG